ncbi:MAG: LCP family protein [Bacillota bacterium]
MSKSQGKRSSVLPIVIAIAAILLGGWAYKSFAFDAVKPVNILLMGLDEGKIRTDVVVLAHLDPKQKLVSLISLPRDTLVEIDCTGLDKACVSPDKLAHAHAYGGEEGAQATVRSVETLLKVKIDHYIRVDYNGFKEVVDSLGGVELVIDQNMYYEDPYAHPPLKISFKASPEPQHLNGQQSLNYVRFRSDARGDIGRTERTKKFLVALASKAKESQNLTKLPSVVRTVLAHVKTDIDFDTALALARAATSINLDQVQTATLPGGDDRNSPRGWVWVADPAKTAELVDRLILNPKPIEAESPEPKK